MAYSGKQKLGNAASSLQCQRIFDGEMLYPEEGLFKPPFNPCFGRFPKRFTCSGLSLP